MFVAELDRPWLDTPFLLQGFVLDDVAQLEMLRKYCRVVYIDRTRSLPESVQHLPIQPAERNLPEQAPVIRVRRIRVHAEPTTGSQRSAHNRPAPEEEEANVSAESTAKQSKEGAHRVPTAPKVVIYGTTPRPASASTAVKFNELLVQAEVQEQAIHESLASRLLNTLSRLWGGKRGTTPAPLQAAGLDTSIENPFIPGTELTLYESTRSIEEELPAARVALHKAATVLDKLVEDIRNGVDPTLADFDGAVSDMVDSVIANPDALMWVARLRQGDAQAYSHGLKVAIYLIGMGRQIGLPREHLNQLGLVGMLLDIGKLKIPRLLLQRAGTLSDDEYATVQQHVARGLELLQQQSSLAEAVLTGIAQHHERLDGSGYPTGLQGHAISLYGRMAGIVDTFTAMTSPRPYAQAYSAYDALAHLYEWSGRLFHEPLIEKFVQAVGIYPVGSLVELSTGEVAIVLAHNRVRRLQPRILVLTGPDKISLKFPRELNLLYQSETVDGQPIRIAAGLPAGSYNLDVRDNYLARQGQ
ncbi:HD-GYP domain-containing protein [Parvibium lacunae]|uniref:HD-GYP domain-containing protein n=2 Tax=Parvibium lacunae TaxID=1888893 RepID=A0A368L1Z8_9BURK|nr:HD-GYP domain-containing protein [Parvibium lacunae]